jgi:methionyl aminopeptidase
MWSDLHEDVFERSRSREQPDDRCQSQRTGLSTAAIRTSTRTLVLATLCERHLQSQIVTSFILHDVMHHLRRPLATSASAMRFRIEWWPRPPPWTTACLRAFRRSCYGCRLTTSQDLLAIGRRLETCIRRRKAGATITAMSIDNVRDLEGIRTAGKVAAAALQALVAATRPGITTADLNGIAGDVYAAHGAHSAPTEVYGFPGDVLISINDEVVHGVPGPRRLVDGDVVKLDVTVSKDGYVADTAKTVVVGTPSPRALALAKCTEEAFEAGLAVARAGVRVNEIGRAIEQVVKARGFTVIRSLSGHGVGRTIHEPPTVPNYHARRQVDLLTDGLVITIEPLICAGAEDVFESTDGWTIKTRDGSLAAHYEHTVMIRKGAAETLT